MKTIFNLLVAIGLMGLAQGQEGGPPQVGFVRLVNAVGAGVGNTMFKVDGEELYPKGYRLGQRTGGIGLEAGNRQIEVRKEGVESGKTAVQVEVGQTTTLVAFAELEKAEDEDEPPVWKGKVLRLKQRDAERGYHLTVVSVCVEADVTFEVATDAALKQKLWTVKRFKTETIKLGTGRCDVQLTQRGGEEALCRLSMDEPGNYVAVLYNDAEGKVRAVKFYDPKFMIAG